MKNLLLCLVCFCALSVYGQEPEFDGHKWEAPYHLSIPSGWTIERFLIPIAFAPHIAYKGVEDIRFTPGWANKESEDYWSYAFLWYLDGAPSINAAITEANLKAYYTGLAKINTDSIKFAALPENVRTVKTSFKQIKTAKGDLKTFNGTISMPDYMQLKSITLNCIVHVRACAQQKKTIVFYKLSPRPYTDKVWAAFNQLWLDFRCKK